MSRTDKMTNRSLSLPSPEMKVLNSRPGTEDGKVAGSTASNGKQKDSNSQSAVDASKELHKIMLKMKGDLIADDGSGVSYSSLNKSPLFDRYKLQAEKLQDIDLTALSEPQKSAFFINVYNALTIHGLSECPQLPSSVLDVQQFWKVTAYNLGSHLFTLDDIEHGVLRANRPHPASRVPPFAPDDKRMQFCVQTFDPRIHFALVCGAKSCPVISVYSEENLDRALDAATSSFCEQEVRVFEVQRQIFVSKLLQWYREDFGPNDLEAIRWTLPYLKEEKQRSIQHLLYLLDKEGMVDINYSDYDWRLNNIIETPKELEHINTNTSHI